MRLYLPKSRIKKVNVELTDFKNTRVLSHTDEDEVSKVLEKVTNKEKAGHDVIRNEIVKYCSPNIEPFLVDIFNRSINQGVFPSSLKVAKVIPLYKQAGNGPSPRPF